MISTELFLLKSRTSSSQLKSPKLRKWWGGRNGFFRPGIKELKIQFKFWTRDSRCGFKTFIWISEPGVCGLSSFITVPMPGGNPSLQVALWVDTLLDLVHVSYGSIKNPPAALGMIPPHFIKTTLEKSGVEIYVIHIEKILQEEF